MISSALDSWHQGEKNLARATEAANGTRPAADIAREWLAENPTRPADFDPEKGTRYTRHLRLRLAYERQMLEAQGGRAAAVKMVKGGTWQGGTIAKVNKSNATGRAVSVAVIVPRVGNWTYQVLNEPGTPYALATVKTERGKPEDYAEPTPESLAELAEFEAAKKAARKKTPKAPSLINPTKEDAEKLQALLNTENELCPWRQQNPGPQSETLEMTQAEYSAASKGSYSRAESSEIAAMGKRPVRGNLWTSKGEAHNKSIGPILCKVRTFDGKSYAARRVIVLTDKPQKPLPAAVWTAYEAPAETPAQ